MSWFTLERGGALLHGRDTGEGAPVLFQHGLGGSEAQAAEAFPDGEGFRRLTLDCRAQGRSTVGDLPDVSIATFAADVLAFAAARGVERFIAGGISMGAAIALRIACLNPERVKALILVRPAWLWDSAPPNMRPYVELADYLERDDAEEALAEFLCTFLAQRLAREAPDNLSSLKNFFAASNRKVLAPVLRAIAIDGPGVSEADVREISAPTLVIGNGIDAVHPLAYAQQLARLIPKAQFLEIPPKALNRNLHVARLRAALSAFLSAQENLQ